MLTLSKFEDRYIYRLKPNRFRLCGHSKAMYYLGFDDNFIIYSYYNRKVSIKIPREVLKEKSPRLYKTLLIDDDEDSRSSYIMIFNCSERALPRILARYEEYFRKDIVIHDDKDKLKYADDMINKVNKYLESK